MDGCLATTCSTIALTDDRRSLQTVHMYRYRMPCTTAACCTICAYLGQHTEQTLHCHRNAIGVLVLLLAVVAAATGDASQRLLLTLEALTVALVPVAAVLMLLGAPSVFGDSTGGWAGQTFRSLLLLLTSTSSSLVSVVSSGGFDLNIVACSGVQATTQ